MVYRNRLAALALYLAVVCSLQGQTARLGRIVFPTSGPAAAQQRFLRGVLLLHSFEYRDARNEFRAAQKLAPGFAMAYWGEAMTYNEPVWFAQDAASGRAVLLRLGRNAAERREKAPAGRERAWLEAVEVLYGSGTKEERDFAYADAMRSLHEAYPEDQEAAAFYALSLLGTCHRGRDFRVYMKAAAIAEEIFTRNPEHPGALHYLIHCYDDPVHAPLGLRAARIYARVAPEAPHAQHMPSHIFFALGLWTDAARSNEDAWAASQKKAAQRQEPVDAGGYHALWWLEYAYLQQGRYRDAHRVLQQMEQIAAVQNSPLTRFHLMQMHTVFAIETGQSYAGRVDTAGLDLPAVATGLFAEGLDAVRSGRQEEGRRKLSALRTLGDSARAGHAITPGAHPGHIYPGDASLIEIMEHELAAVSLMTEGKSKEAIERMKQAVSLEDKTAFEFGPPAPPKPAHELLGEILLQLGQPRLARVQFELALIRTPKRALSLLGLANSLLQMGKKEEARETYQELRNIWKGADEDVLAAIARTLGQL